MSGPGNSNAQSGRALLPGTSDGTEKRKTDGTQGRYMGEDQQDRGLTLILKNRMRRRQRRRLAVLGVLPGLGARAAPVAPLELPTPPPTRLIKSTTGC